jgi:hypothetical protein
VTEHEWLTCDDPNPMLKHLEGPPTTATFEAWGQSFATTVYESHLISERKARLFGIACCGCFADLYDEVHCQRVIDYGVRATVFADYGFVVPTADCCMKAIELAEQITEAGGSGEHLTPLMDAALALHRVGGIYAASHDQTDDYEHVLIATSQIAFAIEHVCSGLTTRTGVLGNRLGGAYESLAGIVWNTAQAAAFRKGLSFVMRISGGDPENRTLNAMLLRDIVGNPFRPFSADPAWLTSTVVTLATGIYEQRAFDRMPILADALQDAGCEDADILDHCRGAGPHVRGCWVVDLLLGKS